MPTLDARSLAPGDVVHCDIAVIGAGAAGLTLAHELAAANLDVALFEAGGWSYDPRTAAQQAVHSVGRPYPMLARSRLGCLGGATHLWGGHCLPIRPSLFATRPAIPNSGWPFTAETLAPFYRRAHEWIGLGDFDYDAVRVAAALGLSLLPLDAARVVSTLARYRARSFATLAAASLAHAASLRTHLHAHATHIELTPNGGAVDHVEFATLDGPHFVVRARRYVLALGGIENARLLLASNSVQPRGIGNDHDLVGRHFMEHIWYHCGTIELQAASDPYPLYGKIHEHDGVGLRAHLALSEPLNTRLQIPDYRAELCLENAEAVGRPRPSARELLEELTLPRHLAAQTRAVRADPTTLPREPVHRPGPVRYRLANHVEQVPNPDSRVRLDPERQDALGRPCALVDWRLTELDARGIERAHQHIDEALRGAGVGHLCPDHPEFDMSLEGADGGGHHMGTTRMHDDPTRGVVDPDGKVHGIAGLFVAGSSVFPCAGFANPTLTIVALALRLADHLSSPGEA